MLEGTNTMSERHSDTKIPLAERTFAQRKPAKEMLVIQYVTENGTGKTYFRFMSPPNNLEGFASNAEEAEARAIEISRRLGLEIHDEIVHVTL